MASQRAASVLTWILVSTITGASTPGFTQSDIPDGVSQLLQERLAAVPLRSTSHSTSYRAPRHLTLPTSADGLPSPRVLFSRRGDDNACALVVRPDATGNRVPEVIVGWDLGKSDNNLEVLRGDSYSSGQEVWALETADGLSGGYFSDIDQLTTFPDVTGDDIEELLTGSSGGGRAATLYNGATGEVLQSFDTYLGSASGWVYDVQVLEDVNNNGFPDFALAVGSDANAVYLVDGGMRGVHHEEIWEFEASDAFFALTAPGDIDGDGTGDLIAATGDNLDDVFAISSTTGQQIWRQELEGSVYDVTTYPDFNGDGLDDIVAGVWDSGDGVAILNSANGNTFWSTGVGSFVMRVVVTDDVNADGFAEIAVASWANSAFLLSGRDGATAWEVPAGGDVWAIDAVADVTGDGLSEVTFGSFSGFAYLADGRTGNLLWEHDANGHKVLAIRSSPDLDGDGIPEVVAGAQQLSAGEDDLLWVLSAATENGQAPIELSVEGPQTPGSTVTISLTGGTPLAQVYWLSGSEGGLFQTPGVGWIAVLPPSVVAQSMIDGQGEAEFSFVIPDDEGLVGQALSTQAIEVTQAMPPLGRSSHRATFEVIDSEL